MRDPAPWRKKYNTMLLLALLFGIFSQYLFVENSLGISVLLFVAAFYGLFFYAVKGRIGGFERWQGQLTSGWLLFVPILLLALTYAIFDNEFFFMMNIPILAGLIIAQTMLLTRGGSQPWHRGKFYVDLLNQWLIEPFAHIAVPFSLVSEQLKSNERSNPARSMGKRVIMGLLLASPLLLIIIALLASADTIFLSWVNGIPAWLSVRSGNVLIARLCIGAGFAGYSFCYIWGLLFRRKQIQQTEIGKQPEKKLLLIDSVTAATFLILINAIYLMFVAIQFSYLFGAADGLLPEGAAYAEYARQGFAELVIVAIINLVILLAGLHLIRPSSKRMELIRKICLSLLMFSTIVILVSAYTRLSLYEEAYGFTWLRLLVHSTMLILGVLLFVALVRIWRDRFSLAKVYVCVVIVSYVIMNYMNLDAFIANNNIERFERTGDIDIHYMDLLSADAAPALIKFQEKYPDHPMLTELKDMIAMKRESAQESTSWQSWNLARQRLK